MSMAVVNSTRWPAASLLTLDRPSEIPFDDAQPARSRAQGSEKGRKDGRGHLVAPIAQQTGEPDSERCVIQPVSCGRDISLFHVGGSLESLVVSHSPSELKKMIGQ